MYTVNPTISVNIKTEERIKATGEVFTPLALCNEILSKLPISASDKSITFIDPACGNGQFLIATAQHRKCLANIFGVDLMVDNVCDTIARLHLFKLGYNDAFDHLGHTNSLVTNIGHDPDEHPTFDWLIENGITRNYQYKHETLTIKIGGMAGDNGIIFKCNDELYPTIVCANSLEFFKDGEQNGYDELAAEIEEFNNNNSNEVITPELIEVVPQTEVVYNEVIKHTPVVVIPPMIEMSIEDRELKDRYERLIIQHSNKSGMKKLVTDTKKALANLKKKYEV